MSWLDSASMYTVLVSTGGAAASSADKNTPSSHARWEQASKAAQEKLKLVSVPVFKRALSSLREGLEGQKGGSEQKRAAAAVSAATKRGETIEVSLWFVKISERVGEVERHAKEHSDKCGAEILPPELISRYLRCGSFAMSQGLIHGQIRCSTRQRHSTAQRDDDFEY